MISENLFLLTSDAQVEILHPRGAAGKSTLGHCLLACENVCVLMTWRHTQLQVGPKVLQSHPATALALFHEFLKPRLLGL